MLRVEGDADACAGAAARGAAAGAGRPGGRGGALHQQERKHFYEGECLCVCVCSFFVPTVVWQGKTMPKKSETSADRKKGVNDLKGKIKDLESESQR